jgi:hypothetical protein
MRLASITCALQLFFFFFFHFFFFFLSLRTIRSKQQNMHWPVLNALLNNWVYENQKRKSSKMSSSLSVSLEQQTEGEEAMIVLYSAYGRGLLKRLEAVDALMRSSPNFAAYVDKCNADLEPELNLKQLLIKPRQRVSEYYGGLRELRRLLPKKAPLEIRIRELLPQLRNVREASDAVGVDDAASGKDDDTADAPPSPPPHERNAAPSLGPPPRITPRSSLPAMSPLGPPPPIVAGRGRRDSYTKRAGSDIASNSSAGSASNRENKDKDKDKKFALFGKSLGRKNEPASPPTAATSHKMFGVPLMELAARERRTVPIFVSVLCNIIEAKGLTIEGIFRTNESKPVENAARERIERGDSPAQAAADPVVAASLIKSWLRELPDPLLTYASYDKFITVGQALNDTRATKLLFKQMINDLPAPHRACTNTLLNVCRFVMDNEAVNKMSAKNLAIVLAPNMLRPRADPHADHTKMVSEMQDAVNIVAAMISLHENQTAESDTTTSSRGVPVEHKLSGSPVIVGGDPVAPELTPPPLDPFDGLPPPPPEPAEDIAPEPATSPRAQPDSAHSEQAPPPPDEANDAPPPPAQRAPVMNMQQQRQRALATEMAARRQVARPSSGGSGAMPTRAPPPNSASRRGPATTDSLNLSALSAAPPTPTRSTLSPRVSEDHRASLPAPTTPAPTPAAASRSTEERIAHLESSNAALVALTARLEERIAQLELQLMSK